MQNGREMAQLVVLPEPCPTPAAARIGVLFLSFGISRLNWPSGDVFGRVDLEEEL